MRLRNKKTGGLASLEVYDDHLTMKTDAGWHDYNTLSELNEDWEDYEEPKEYWYIAEQATVVKMANNPNDIPNFVGRCLSIGNLFETKEEAEKAVKKLKAWERLKDKGFRFTGWDRHPDYPGDYRITASDDWTCDDKDLDLLFGGEE